MGYQTKESVVRADIFKQSGKWSHSIELDMNDFYHEPYVNDAVKKALIKQYGYNLDGANENGFIVILEPYHVTSFPVVIWL